MSNPPTLVELTDMLRDVIGLTKSAIAEMSERITALEETARKYNELVQRIEGAIAYHDTQQSFADAMGIKTAHVTVRKQLEELLK